MNKTHFHWEGVRGIHRRRLRSFHLDLFIFFLSFFVFLPVIEAKDKRLLHDPHSPGT